MDCVFVPFSTYNWNLGHASALPWNPTVYCLISTFLGISIWQSFEVLVQVYFTFKSRKGLYFWSIVITSWGLSLRATGWILKFFVPDCNSMLATAVVEIGWSMMTTGLSVVLYSRLHLVVHNRRTLRLVLSMIVVDAIILHIPMIVIQFGIVSDLRPQFLPISTPFERVQITLFTIQETIISGIYIWAAVKLLKRGYNVQTRTVMSRLIVIQVVVILIDVLLITLDFANMFILKAALHGLGYAIKLQLEFEILNQLLQIIKNGLTREPPPPSSPITAVDDNSSNTSSSLAESASPSPKWNKKSSFSEKIRDSASFLNPISPTPKTKTIPPPSPQHIVKTAEFQVSHHNKSSSSDLEMGTKSQALRAEFNEPPSLEQRETAPISLGKDFPGSNGQEMEDDEKTMKGVDSIEEEEEEEEGEGSSKKLDRSPSDESEASILALEQQYLGRAGSGDSSRTGRSQIPFWQTSSSEVRYLKKA